MARPMTDGAKYGLTAEELKILGEAGVASVDETSLRTALEALKRLLCQLEHSAPGVVATGPLRAWWLGGLLLLVSFCVLLFGLDLLAGMVSRLSVTPLGVLVSIGAMVGGGGTVAVMLWLAKARFLRWQCGKMSHEIRVRIATLEALLDRVRLVRNTERSAG